MLKRCAACRGKKEIMGAGMIFHKCKTCLGVGYVEEAENNAEQDILENTQDAQAKANVDTGASDNGKTKRKYVRKATVGISKQDLSEREESQQGR